MCEFSARFFALKKGV